MKFHLALATVLIQFCTVTVIYAQSIAGDTTLASQYFATANAYFDNKSYDTAIDYFNKISSIYENHGQWRKYLQSETKLGECYQNLWQLDHAIAKIKPAIEKSLLHINEKDTLVADAYHILGKQYYYQSNNDSTLYYWGKTLRLRKELFGEANGSVAKSHNNIGIVYYQKCEYDLALDNYFKALHIYQEMFGQTNMAVAKIYSNIGVVYWYKNEYDLALKQYFEAIKIFELLPGEMQSQIADVYNNIGNVYFANLEYDLSLQYHLIALQMHLEILGEKHFNVALDYENIGTIYSKIKENDLALDYYYMSLEIDEGLFGEKHTHVAEIYSNIGLAYSDENEYDLALENYDKSLKIFIELQGRNNASEATIYKNIATIYARKNIYDLALEYYIKALQIKKEILGDRHTSVAEIYHSIGDVYCNRNQYNLALQYYQKGLTANLRYFSDSINIFTVPLIDAYLNWNVLLESLQAKAEIFAGHNKDLPDFFGELPLVKSLLGLKTALRHYQACDTLIDNVRHKIAAKSDKIALGNKASEVYEHAIEVCLKLSGHSRPDSASYYSELAFCFSEKNKSAVFRESIAAAEAQKFAGIPDSLLRLDHSLSINIASYKQILAGGLDSLSEINFQEKLFKANRSYDSLIAVLEKDFPKYYELKYNQKLATVADIQAQLEPKTAMISYFIGDSVIAIFTLTSEKLDVATSPKGKDFDTIISDFRYFGLAYRNNPVRFARVYKQMAYDLYLKLIPRDLGEEIDRLIIIPDAILGTIPFETFLTAQPTNQDWKDLPYLLRKYNVSYAHSASLFYNRFLNNPLKDYETIQLNDWLALAPVFDDVNTAGTNLKTRNMLGKFYTSIPDTISTRGMLFNGETLAELPATETEVKAIFDAFDRKNLRAAVKTHQEANEAFVKSGALENFKILHFATHGYVNTSEPELSGIFLAQDTLSNEDGILYSGEMYNLDLNADLIVLSACETGLGKISKGEGIIGLSRALLYAGAKNLIVSLWQVPDRSTSELMISFYKNMLNDDRQNNISDYLHQAKLSMINEGTYSHPYYWSPFILIGK
nr:CHAT domain-containing protein [Bacteroidota bacterium]